MNRWATGLAALSILLLNLWINGPLFAPGELPFRGSIEGGYAGMARFISQHPNPWGWNPFTYCGLPTQFMYPPLLLYVAGLGMRLLPHASPDWVWRVIVSMATCLGPVTLFFFALCFTRSRKWAFAAAVAYSLFSPSYGLFPAIEKDRGIVQLPWRIQVLAKYGEGPHNTGLTLLPLALIGLWRFLVGQTARSARDGHVPLGRRPVWGPAADLGVCPTRSLTRLFISALLLAAIPLINWVAAFALAISCLILFLAAWGEPNFRFWRALAAAGLAYLLACFWLTPSFVRTIAFNWPVDSFAYHLHVKQAWLIAGMIAGAIIIRIAFRLLQGSFYLCLVTLGAFVFGWIATAYYLYGVDTIPESRRYAIEFEFFLMLALFEALRLALSSPNSTVRLSAWGTAGVMLLVGLPQLWAYYSQGWRMWWPVPPETTVEYKLAKWIADHPPHGRVFASGGLRFRLNSWFDIQQVGGGFETGLQNRVPVDMAYRIRSTNEDPLPELQALDVQYVVVHGPKSREYYRDFKYPERLAKFPAVFHVEDDTIYEVPTRPSHVEWLDSNSFIVSGAGMVETLVNDDPGWRGPQIERDQLGFMRVRAPAELQYRGTAEQRIMAALSGLAWLAALTAVIRSRRTPAPSRPATAP